MFSLQLKRGSAAVDTHTQTCPFPYCKRKARQNITVPTTYSYAGTKKNGSVWYQIKVDVHGDAIVENDNHNPTPATCCMCCHPNTYI
jgi:hypothetical protein